MDFLVSEDFFTAEDLEDALAAIQDGEDDVRARVRRVVDVVMEFKAAAE